MFKQSLLTGWTFMRWLRLAIVISMIIQTFISHDPFYAVIAVFFLFQVISNVGCCSTNSCSTPLKKTDSNTNN